MQTPTCFLQAHQENCWPIGGPENSITGDEMKEKLNLLSSSVSGPERQREILAAARSRLTRKLMDAMLYEMVTGRPPFGGLISGHGQDLRLLVYGSQVWQHL